MLGTPDCRVGLSKPKTKVCKKASHSKVFALALASFKVLHSQAFKFCDRKLSCFVLKAFRHSARKPSALASFDALRSQAFSFALASFHTLRSKLLGILLASLLRSQALTLCAQQPITSLINLRKGGPG